MKKYGQKLVSMCLVLAMLLAMVPVVNTQAATTKTKTKTKTLTVGDVITVSCNGKVKSISSSKKSIVTAKKYDGHYTADGEYYTKKVKIVAKKVGSTTLTIKTSASTYKYTIKVKKLDITAKLSYMGENNEKLLLTVKNNSKDTFDAVDLTYTLKDETGWVIKKDKKVVFDVAAGKTVYAYIDYDESWADGVILDLSKSTVEATGQGRNIDSTYTDVSKKVKTTVEPEWDGTTVTFSIKAKNPTSHLTYGYYYIRIFDEDGCTVDLISGSLYLEAGATKSYTGSSSFASGIDTSGYTYKVTTVAYHRTR
jgi:hypothetical protein